MRPICFERRAGMALHKDLPQAGVGQGSVCVVYPRSYRAATIKSACATSAARDVAHWPG